MRQIRTVIAFIGGLLLALVMGLVPAELIGWLRDQSSLGGPDSSDPAQAAEGRRSGRRRRGPRRKR